MPNPGVQAAIEPLRRSFRQLVEEEAADHSA